MCSSDLRLRQPGIHAGFEALRTFEEAETPGEQPALTHPSRGGREAGAGQVLQDPGDQSKDASPGRRSRGEWTVAARRPGVSVATLTLPTGRVVVRSPKERARRNGRPDAWGATPSRSASRGRARSRLREPSCRSVRARGLQLERSSGGEEPHEGHDPRVDRKIEEGRRARGRKNAPRSTERREGEHGSTCLRVTRRPGFRPW